MFLQYRISFVQVMLRSLVMVSSKDSRPTTICKQSQIWTHHIKLLDSIPTSSYLHLKSDKYVLPSILLSPNLLRFGLNQEIFGLLTNNTKTFMFLRNSLFNPNAIFLNSLRPFYRRLFFIVKNVDSSFNSMKSYFIYLF